MRRVLASFLLFFLLSGQSTLAAGGVPIETLEGIERPVNTVSLFLVASKDLADDLLQRVKAQKKPEAVGNAAVASAASAAEAEQPVPSTLETSPSGTWFMNFDVISTFDLLKDGDQWVKEPPSYSGGFSGGLCHNGGIRALYRLVHDFKRGWLVYLKQL